MPLSVPSCSLVLTVFKNIILARLTVDISYFGEQRITFEIQFDSWIVVKPD